MLVRIRRWPANLGLQWRIQVLTVIGLLAIFAFFWLAGQRAINESTQQSLAHQLTVARLVASLLEHRLNAALSLLETTAARPPLRQGRPSDSSGTLLKEAQLQLSAYGRRLYWLTPAGNILWSEPFDPALQATPFPYMPAITPTLQTGAHHVSNLCRPNNTAQPFIFLTAPVSGSDNETAGLLVEEIGAAQLGLAGMLEQVAPDGNAYIEVVDHQGTVLASSVPERCFEKGDHSNQFAGLINRRQPVVGECHQCHTGGGQSSGRVGEVLAFVPLTTIPWGVAVRQPSRDVLAPVNHLRQYLLWGGGAIIVVVLLAATWFVRREIAGPIQALDEASAQLAAGNLAVPIRKGGIDEVARLTANLEQMRVRLDATLQDQRHWNEILEEMVAERTRELTLLYEQLEGKAATCKQLLGKVLTAQEEERTRLARELHDAIGQSLTAIIMAAASVEKSLPPDFERGRQKLGRVRDIAAQSLQDLRALIFDLRPETLDDLGLALALQSQAKKHLEPAGVQVQLKTSGLQHRLPADVETVVFRVVQEAITNIARHAQARQVTISLAKKESRLIVRVEDDGVGFNPAGVLNGRRQAWGLRGMEERITLLGGNFSLNSQPGGGTLVLAEVPLNLDENQAGIPAEHTP